MSPTRKISHNWDKTNVSVPAKDGTNRSGQGVAVPTFIPEPSRVGRLPRQLFLIGDYGSPSSTTDVTASRIMQTTCTDDVDDVCAPREEAVNDSLLRTFINQIVESLKKEDDDDLQDTSEMSGCGAVAGVTLPLGMSTPRRKKTRHPWKTGARAFGNAKRVKGLGQ